MARGDKERVAQQATGADTQLGITNTAAAGQAQNAQQMFGMASPAVQQMIRSPGYSEETKGTMRRDAYGGVSSAFDAADASAKNRVAATGNSAGYNEVAAELARAKGRELGDTSGRLDMGFEQESQRQREGGQQAAINMFGMSQDAMARLYGYGPGTLEARKLVLPREPGWTEKFGNVAKGLKDISEIGGSKVSPFG